MGEVTLNVVFEEVEDGWIQARLSELPAVITAAPTRDEAREMIVDALREYLSAQADEDLGGEHEFITLELKHSA